MNFNAIKDGNASATVGNSFYLLKYLEYLVAWQ